LPKSDVVRWNYANVYRDVYVTSCFVIDIQQLITSLRNNVFNEIWYCFSTSLEINYTEFYSDSFGFDICIVQY